jgi:hypothetical protein
MLFYPQNTLKTKKWKDNFHAKLEFIFDKENLKKKSETCLKMKKQAKVYFGNSHKTSINTL